MVALSLAGVSAQARPAFGQFLGRRGGTVIVAGTLTSTRGSPLSSIRVNLETAIGDLVRTTLTDSTGSFSFGSVAPGSYVIAVSVRGYQAGSWHVQVGRSDVVGLMFSLTPDETGSASGDKPNGSPTVSVHQLLVPAKALKEYDKAVTSADHGKIDDAIRHWKKSIEIYPQYAKSYMQLSRVYADRGEFHLAMAAARRAVALDGKSDQPYTFLGYVYLKEHDYLQARKAFTTAVGISDADWFSQFWLGTLLLREQKDAQAAYPHLLRASRLNPEMEEVYISLYNDLLALHRGQEALAELDAFLKQFPKSPLAATVREKRESLKKSLAAQAH